MPLSIIILFMKKAKIPIFLIDDHELVRESIKDLLEISGFFKVVGQASNGLSAMGKISTIPEVGFVILDVNLPDINGIKLIPKILEICPKTKVVMLTMNEGDEIRENAIKYGASGFFTKSFQRDQFINGLLELFYKKKRFTQKTVV